jgi:hypothetical protein
MVNLKSTSSIPYDNLLKTKGLADFTGISFVDSTSLRVCYKIRLYKIKSLKNTSQLSMFISLFRVLNFML